MTELHTIEVRYEDVDGRHVDVHDAARARSNAVTDDGRYVVDSDVCGCCDATEKITSYNEENVVKVAYGPSGHERDSSGGISGTRAMFWVMIALLVFYGFMLVYYHTGGTVSL